MLPVSDYLRTYDDSDIYWLSRLIEAEAQGESYTGKVAVGNCVLNRVITDSYPNNVVKVIFDTNYGVQYQPTKNGTIYNTPSQVSTRRLRRSRARVPWENACFSIIRAHLQAVGLKITVSIIHQ